MLTFTPGTHVIMSGERHTLVGSDLRGGNEIWTLRRRRDALAIEKSRLELETLYAGNELRTDYDDYGLSPELRAARRSRNQASVTDLSPAKQDRYRRVFALLAELDGVVRFGTGDVVIVAGEHRGRTNLDVALENLGKKHDIAMSRSKYFRYRKYLRDGDPRRALIGDHAAKGNRRQLQPEVARIVTAVHLERLEAAQTDGSDRRKLTSQAEMGKEIKTRIDNANLGLLPPAASLRVPSQSTLQTRWNLLPAYERSVAKVGLIRTHAIFRGPRGGHEAMRPLDVVEFDEVELPFYFFDELLNIPLGRAWLCWFLDRCTHQVVGLYLGFEEPSDLAICSAARHACLPKSWMSAHYPMIGNRWEASGIGRLWTFDNSLTAWGHTVDSMTANLGTNSKWTPVRSPWLKHVVEGMHQELNTGLLSSMPGYVLDRSLAGHDYDPTKMGCIGLRVFLSIFLKWLLDVYQVSQHNILRAPPLMRWRELCKDTPPGLPDSASNLDVTFGVLREATINRRLDHNGVVFEDIYYWSDEIEAMRYRNGDTLRVEAKINPSDLGRIKIYDSRANMWIDGYARDQDYARGLSLHVHKLHKKHAAEHFRVVDPQTLLEARHALTKMITDAPLIVDRLRTNAKVARAMQVGTQGLFDAVDHVGNLMPTNNRFEGMKLDPYAGPDAPRIPSAPGDARAFTIVPEIGRVANVARALLPAPEGNPAPAGAAPPGSDAGTAPTGKTSEPAAPPRSPFAFIPRLVADQSLTDRGDPSP